MSEYEFENTPSGIRWKFVAGGIIIVGAIIYLIASSAAASAQYFLTVEEAIHHTQENGLDGRNLRVSGAVLGDSIEYDMDSLELEFTIAHVPGDNQILEEQGGLARALHQAVNDPDAAILDVAYTGPVPDLLQHEAQAILTGRIGDDGVFYADEILLKCPTKYESSVPGQSEE